MIIPDANSLLEVAVRNVVSSEIGGARVSFRTGSRKDAKTQRGKEEMWPQLKVAVGTFRVHFECGQVVCAHLSA